MTVKEFGREVEPVTGDEYIVIGGDRNDTSPTPPVSSCLADIATYVSTHHPGASTVMTITDADWSSLTQRGFVTTMAGLMIASGYQWQLAFQLWKTIQVLKATGYGWIVNIIQK